MKTPPIDSEEDYDRALARLAEIIDAAKGSPEAIEREALLEAIEEYEDAEYPIEPLTGK
jgi:HTH-type transcriptional regulator/antitoxin HigA